MCGLSFLAVVAEVSDESRRADRILFACRLLVAPNLLGMASSRQAKEFFCNLKHSRQKFQRIVRWRWIFDSFTKTLEWLFLPLWWETAEKEEIPNLNRMNLHPGISPVELS